MNVAEMRIDRVGARDIDLLVAETIVKNPEFARLFLEDGEDGLLSLISMKLWQNKDSGKPDLTAVFQTEKDRLMLLLVDKVAKMTRKSNQETMESEGQKNVKNGSCDRYRCVLLTAETELDANREELDGFPVVTYEQIKDALADDPWGSFVMTRGIADKKQPYSEKKNNAIVDFANKYSKHVKNRFPDLSMKQMEKKVGSMKTTVQFSTSAKTTIYHKPENGVVDVQTKLHNYDYDYFAESIKPFLFAGMKTRKKNNNAIIYMEVPIIDFEGDFEAQKDDLNMVLEAAVQMQEFLEEMDYGGIEQLLKDGTSEDEEHMILFLDENGQEI